jgi:dolichol kinase
MLRKHERRDFTGASYLLTSAIVCVAIFPPMIAFLAMCFLSIGDTFAAIIGMNFGKRKIRNTSKSFEGALACFITTLSFGILINYNIPIDHIWYLNPIVVTCGAVAATIAETSNIDIDDNVKIPIISGIVMSITYIFV